MIEGEIPANVQRDKVELYGRNHFVIMTGNVLNPSPIRNYQQELSNMASQMVSSANIAELEELDATESDDVIIARASAAKNGTKFDALWTGCLDGFPSQSEADMALFEMLCFYSKSNEQCRRLFRLSALGQRDKATKNNTYLDRTLAKVRGRQQAEALPLVDFFSALLAPPLWSSRLRHLRRRYSHLRRSLHRPRLHRSSLRLASWARCATTSIQPPSIRCMRFPLSPR